MKKRLAPRITSDPAVCHGEPCIEGTRIFITLILDNLADGVSEAEILANYPGLTLEDIRAAVGYASSVLKWRTSSKA